MKSQQNKFASLTNDLKRSYLEREMLLNDLHKTFRNHNQLSKASEYINQQTKQMRKAKESVTSDSVNFLRKLRF